MSVSYSVCSRQVSARPQGSHCDNRQKACCVALACTLCIQAVQVSRHLMLLAKGSCIRTWLKRLYTLSCPSAQETRMFFVKSCTCLLPYDTFTITSVHSHHSKMSHCSAISKAGGVDKDRRPCLICCKDQSLLVAHRDYKACKVPLCSWASQQKHTGKTQILCHFRDSQ